MFSFETKTSKLLLTILLAIICMVASLLLFIIINPDDLYQGLFLTTGQLIATLIILLILKINREDLGLIYSKSNISMHLSSITALLIIILLVKYVVEGVQSVNEITFEVWYYLIFYSVVAITEELYFRGVLYHILETWSPLIALIGSSIIFGLFHIRSGVGVVLVMMITGLTFAIVRYISDMIILLIPFHLLFNFQSVLFTFNESNTISAGLYVGLSVLLVVIFLVLQSKRVEKNEKFGNNTSKNV